MVADRTVCDDLFLSEVQRAARRLLVSVPDLTAKERDFIYKLHRYGLTAVQRYLDIASRSVNPADGAAFEQALRGYRQRNRVLLYGEIEMPFTTWRDETHTQAVADPAQGAVIINPSKANRESAIYHTTAHIEAAIRFVDSLHQQSAKRAPLVVVDGGLGR